MTRCHYSKGCRYFVKISYNLNRSCNEDKLFVSTTTKKCAICVGTMKVLMSLYGNVQGETAKSLLACKAVPGEVRLRLIKNFVFYTSLGEPL